LKNKPTNIAIVLLLLFFSSSIWLVFEYVDTEKQRDMSDWQARLNIMAESQQYSIDDWFAGQVENGTTLANNPLLQLYVSQLSSDDYASGSARDETMRGQLNHLKNLINATAEHARVFTPINKIKNNIENTVNDGIAIVNKSGVLLATRYFPVSDAAVTGAYKQALAKKSVYISNIYAAQQGSGESQPRLIIAVPVSTVQAMSSDDYKAAVVAVINPKNSLYKLLLKKWLTTQTDETLLVAVDENRVSYLSPLKNGFVLFHSQPRSSSAAAEVAVNIGSFVTNKDYRQIDVLATARTLRNSDMVMVQKIDVEEALAESREHQNFILIVFILVVFIVTIGFIAIWKHASSLRLLKATRRLKARAELLNAVGDSINDHIFLLDHNNRLVFINDALAKSFSVDDVDVRGKALNHIFNSEITQRLLAIKPGDTGKNVRNKEMRLEFKNRRRDYHVSVVALSHPDYKQSHLFVMHDITELKDAQGRRNRLMDGIISTLANVIDKHDPYCIDHSERTREVAVAIARAMELPGERVGALAMAALLANIGKLYIPAEMLTNVEPLTKAEELMLRENTNHSVDILKDLEFDGPVIDFVQQKNECLDGSGYPKGLSGDDIFLESRILSVANAFVAMTSSRAYRSGKPIKEVLDVLMSEAGTRYDRQVIAALFHIAENHSDWVSWQRVS
jgi:PAS domain S-box-containing protein